MPKSEAEGAAETPRLYLISPRDFSAEALAQALSQACAGGDVACLRLRVGERAKADARAAVAAVQPACVAADVALLLEDAPSLAAETGADGAHLSDGARRVKAARETLGDDAIVGAFCGASRHAGLVAGEAGADYVAFGPVAAAIAADADAERAPPELFAWWSEMIELPVVAEGGIAPALLINSAPKADFVALSPKVWLSEDPEAAVRAVSEALRRDASA